MRLATRFIVLCWLIASPAVAATGSAGPCGACHASVRRTGAHAALSCPACHGPDGGGGRRAVAGGIDAPASCASAGCHADYAGVLSQSMATRASEKAFAARTAGVGDPAFFGNACGGCHVASCRDCHVGGAHATSKPGTAECLRCHSDEFTGAEYLGLAPREENARYGRGIAKRDDHYLKMLPDVHAEAGMPCGACHAMKSLAAGRKSSKACTDCHAPSPGVVEHAIAPHMAGMTCAACHSAWVAQAYGTFFLRTGGSDAAISAFDLRHIKGGYLKSVYLRRQDAPPLGLNAQGKVSPIVPRFILYTSDIRPGVSGRVENRLLAAEWKAIFPHTVRRGSVTCEGCHDAPARWMREPVRDRIRRLRDDGMTLASFRDREGQRVANGAFLDDARVASLAARGKGYKVALVKKWKRLIDRVDGSLRR